MAEHDLDQLIADAVTSVLETMFFTLTDRGSPTGPDAPTPLIACVAFHGSCSGSAEIRLTEDGARLLAANFLGEQEDQLARPDLEMMVCELANMLTGSVVSRLPTNQTFDLGTPRIVLEPGRELANTEPATAQRRFELEAGALTMILRIAKAA